MRQAEDDEQCDVLDEIFHDDEWLRYIALGRPELNSLLSHIPPSKVLWSHSIWRILIAQRCTIINNRRTLSWVQRSPAFLSLAYSSAAGMESKMGWWSVRIRGISRANERPSRIINRCLGVPGKKSLIRKKRIACLQGIHSIIQEMAGQWLGLRFNMISFFILSSFRVQCLLCKTGRRLRGLRCPSCVD